MSTDVLYIDEDSPVDDDIRGVIRRQPELLQHLLEGETQPERALHEVQPAIVTIHGEIPEVTLGK